MSCSACQNIFLSQVTISPRSTDAFSTDNVNGHHDNISSLCNAALNGCRICTDLWRHFFKQKTPEQYAAEPFFYNSESFLSSNTSHVYFGSGTSYRFREAAEDQPDSSADESSFVLEFILNSPMVKDLKDYTYLIQKADIRALMSLMQETSEEYTTSSGTMNMVAYESDVRERKRWNLVRKWISGCSSTHSRCKARSSRPGFLPTRVIHVPPGPLSLDAHLKIIDTTGGGATSLGDSYLSLSHCWGTNKKPRYRTTKENLASRTETGISWKELPTTFRDAIQAAKHLRVPFVWIDSLCIIQGDEADWIAESAKMADVYQNAYLNLSATSASSSHDGLTSSHELHPRLMRTAWYGDRQEGIYRLIDMNFWRDRIADAEVNTRGWVLQERTLAPRILHFCFDQVAWECCHMSASEEFPDGLPQELLDGHSTFKQKTDITPSLLTTDQTDTKSDEDGGKEAAYNLWARMVSMYGRCDLSYPDQDKLVAISGLAGRIHNLLHGDDYLAGLWRGNLYGGLLWEVDRTRRFTHRTVAAGLYSKRHEDAQRARAYRAPSWSWASVDGLVDCWPYVDVSGKSVNLDDGSSLSITPRAKILSISTTPRLPDHPLGQIQQGSLVIQGRLYKLGREGDGYRFTSGIFAASKEYVHTRVDEPTEWTAFDEAYFLPIVLKTRIWDVKPHQLQKIDEMLQEALNLNDGTSSGTDKANTKGESSSQTSRSVQEITSVREGQGNHDTVAGIVLCPTENRQSFSRIGLIEIYKIKISKLDDLAGIASWEQEAAHSRKSTPCSPDGALAQGSLVVGEFEIV